MRPPSTAASPAARAWWTSGRILDEAGSGAFAREWAGERAGGRTTLARLRQAARSHPAERTGRELRAGMRWLDGAEED